MKTDTKVKEIAERNRAKHGGVEGLITELCLEIKDNSDFALDLLCDMVTSLLNDPEASEENKIKAKKFMEEYDKLKENK